MAQKKAYEVDTWLARPDPRIGIVLLYGPDRGLVSERAKRFAKTSGLPLNDPFSVVRIDAAADDAEGRLLDEARMVPMFAARRLIWVRNAGAQKPLAEAVAELGRAPLPDAVVLIEAGELKKGAPLRTAVEGSSQAMALPCYADEDKAVDALIEEELRRSRLTIAPETRAVLRALLGGDRMASRGELEKLALHAGPSGEITLADVRTLTGDVSTLSNDDMIDHVLSGNGKAFGDLFARHVRTPSQLHTLLAGALRQLQVLHLLRGRMEASRLSAAAAIGGMKPPPFPPRRATLENALARWTAALLQDALTQLQAAVLEGRRRPDLALAIAERALLRVASTRNPAAGRASA